MRKITYIINLLVITSIIFMASCKKDSENVSTITYYPVFTYNGDQFMSVHAGGSFTDPGVTALLDGKNWPVLITGSVDTITPGVYTLTYTSTNPEGFSNVTYRYVGVISPDAAARDLSGKYVREIKNDTITVTKIADGVYLDNDIGGAPTFQIKAYFFNTTDSTIIVPLQQTSAGMLQCINGEIDATGLEWVVINGNFGTSTRYFVKQ